MSDDDAVGPEAETASINVVTPEQAEPEPKPEPEIEAVKQRYYMSASSSYLSNGVLDTKTEYQYEGKLLVIEQTFYADGTRAGSVENTYQGGLVVLKAKKDPSEITISAHSYRYDSAGYLIRDSLLDEKGNPIFSYVYDYDEKGRRTQLRILSNDDLLLSYAEYRYEGDKNIRTDIYSAGGELQEYLERTYNDLNQPVLELIIEVGGSEIEKVRFEYSEGKQTGREVYRHTRKTGSEIFRYDEFGNLSTRIRIDRSGSLVETIEYVYEEVQ